ncbi:transposase [Allohahella sp. A8]|uniref:transposase n=1 Tax=Allohahella sp. A8 TaxID=3141461 RepID=UPI003A800F5D
MTKRYTEEQIVRALEDYASGTESGTICEQLGISRATLYSWRRKYAQLGVKEIWRLQELEAENRKLKKMLSERTVELEAMKDVCAKKW